MNLPSSTNPQRMQCMEIWGGNREIDQSFEAPGVDIHVYSRPYMQSKTGGGDIYYLTSCASGRISRFLLADVSGHGATAARIATSLRDMLRNNVNRISQEKFVTQMNREFGQLSAEDGFATAVVATFFQPTRSLDISLAGHPNPFYYQSDSQSWSMLVTQQEEQGLQNLPLGIHDDSHYPGDRMKTVVGDMFLLYSDAFIESVDEQNQMLGTKGLLDLLNQAGPLKPSEVVSFLVTQVKKLSEENLKQDDATLVLGHCTPSKTRFVDNLVAPFRLFKGVGDHTELKTISPSVAGE